jgi:hypothetical protein
MCSSGLCWRSQERRFRLRQAATRTRIARAQLLMAAARERAAEIRGAKVRQDLNSRISCIHSSGVERLSAPPSVERRSFGQGIRQGSHDQSALSFIDHDLVFANRHSMISIGRSLVASTSSPGLFVCAKDCSSKPWTAPRLRPRGCDGGVRQEMATPRTTSSFWAAS